TQVKKEAPRLTLAAGLGRLGPVADVLRDAAVAAVEEPQPVVPERPAPTLGRREQSALRAEIAKVLGRTDVGAALTEDALASATPSRASAVTQAMRSALTSAKGEAFGVTAALDTDTLLPAVAGQLGRATTTLTPGGI